ncbi:MAG: acetylglutamate kinase [Myxococcales bacterium]|nr:acetylglutamate kinase [Myxococcales bacterium]
MTAPVVLKLGGEVVAGPHLEAIAADVAELASSGVPVVVVHGGGPQATDLQKRLGQTPNIVAGRRITDTETLDVMKMTVAGKVNVDLCAALVAAGGKPVGLHGASSRVVEAVKRPPKVMAGAGPEPIDFGHVGDVVGVNRDLVALLLGHGYTPVIACLGADAAGHVFNINADTVANRLAVALDARALVLITDVPGVLRDIADLTTRIPKLTRAEARAAIESGVITKGMIPKVEESFAAITDGVRAVHIVGRIARGDLAREARTPGSVGTVLVE